MKIAIVTPALQDPERLFGAERHFVGMVNAFRERLDTDWIQVRVDESTWEGVLQSYVDCFDRDLSCYDAVISTKTPTFMVQHPHHVCWLLHQIRVFYDRFDDEYGKLPARERSEKRKQQQIIRELDDAGFSQLRKIFTNGYETARRLKYYNGFAAEVLHPPVFSHGHYCDGQQYFFLPGRLHRWKRVDLAIRAMRYYSGDVPLLIAGTGEDEAYFRELAADDPRIHFLGFVSDEEMLAFYANALAVLFVPKDEDFGYITVEAMLSHKPVIVCTDSGEPARLIENGRSGYIVKPEAVEIAAAMSLLASDRELARQMGEAAHHSTPSQSWDEVIEKLLDGAIAGTRRPSIVNSENTASLAPLEPRFRGPAKVLVTDNQVLEPAVGGSRVRVKELCKGLASHFPTEYIGAYDWPGPLTTDDWPLPTWHSRVFALSSLQYKLAARLQKYVHGGSVIDVAFPWMTRLSKNFVNALRASARDADVVVFTHPWCYPLCKHLLSGKAVIYDAHNFEWGLRSDLLSPTFVGRRLSSSVRRVEGELVRRCDEVWACSREDADAMARIYDVPRSKFCLVPNCADTVGLRPATKAQRDAAKAANGWVGRKVVLFVGSGYRPNTEAAAFIIEQLAPRLPEIVFAIAGSVKEDYLRNRHATQLVERLGLALTPVCIAAGWYDVEHWADGTSIRWTAPVFHLEVPGNAGALRLQLASPKHNRLTIEQGDKTISVNDLAAGENTLEFQVDARGPIVLKLQEPYRTPTDPRALGCAVSRIEWRTGHGQWESLPLDKADVQALLPQNVELLGVISEKALYSVLHASDIALNPVEMGSGTNLKLLQYMAAGLPILSTEAGIRGIEGAQDLCLVQPLGEFESALRTMLQAGEELAFLGEAARAEAQANYDWNMVTDRAAKRLQWLLRDRAPQEDPFFSVVIPSYNRPDRLLAALSALTRQSFRDFEVVVVDQSDPPIDIQQELRKQLRIKYVHSVERGPALARNKGWRAASGQVIAFTDDDCVPDVDWLKNASRYFRERPIAGLEGLVRSEHVGDPRYRTVCNVGFEGVGFMTANMFYRRDALERVGGLDERFRFAFREDTDLAWRVLRLGEIPFAEDSEVFHPPHPVNLERESPAERAKMFSVDPILLEEDPERYIPLLYREGHYRRTVGFWQHFVRGMEEHELHPPVHELLLRLREWDPEWWRAVSVADGDPALPLDPADIAALQSLIQTHTV
jgi:glycosyltransferase involved in cell wall biosynthesis